MRSKLTLLTTAAALAFGLTATSALAADATGDAPGAKSDITIVGTNQGGAAGGAVGDDDEAGDGGAGDRDRQQVSARTHPPGPHVPSIGEVQRRRVLHAPVPQIQVDLLFGRIPDEGSRALIGRQIQEPCVLVRIVDAGEGDDAR